MERFRWKLIHFGFLYLLISPTTNAIFRTNLRPFFVQHTMKKEENGWQSVTRKEAIAKTKRLLFEKQLPCMNHLNRKQHTFVIIRVSCFFSMSCFYSHLRQQTMQCSHCVCLCVEAGRTTRQGQNLNIQILIYYTYVNEEKNPEPIYFANS